MSIVTRDEDGFVSAVVAESIARKFRYRLATDARVRDAHDSGDCWDRCPLCRDENDDDTDAFPPLTATDLAVAAVVAHWAQVGIDRAETEGTAA